MEIACEDQSFHQRFLHHRKTNQPSIIKSSIPSIGTMYRCGCCGTDLNLTPTHQYPPGSYFEAGDKGTVSFAWVDESKLRFEKENKFQPFYETINYWGIQRKRTRMLCDTCGSLVGHIYDDGPPMMTGIGQFGFGPSQAVPRAPRYRFKTKAITIS